MYQSNKMICDRTTGGYPFYYRKKNIFAVLPKGCRLHSLNFTEEIKTVLHGTKSLSINNFHLILNDCMGEV
jgi:hypothetical protein